MDSQPSTRAQLAQIELLQEKLKRSAGLFFGSEGSVLRAASLEKVFQHLPSHVESFAGLNHSQAEVLLRWMERCLQESQSTAKKAHGYPD